MKQLCAQIPPKTDSNGVGNNGVGNFEADASVSKNESKSMYELSGLAKRDSGQRPENEWMETAGAIAALLEVDDARSVLILQETAYARMFIDLYREYEIAKVIRETIPMMNEAYLGYETKEQETHGLFILKENYQALSKYFEKTKEVGLGLPDKAAMRMGHLLYSLEVVIRRIDKDK